MRCLPLCSRVLRKRPAGLEQLQQAAHSKAASQADRLPLPVRARALQNVPRYLNLVKGTEEVESCLMEGFAEHLNAEIVLDTIKDVSMAISWLKTTFMWQRIRRNPAHYKARHWCWRAAAQAGWLAGSSVAGGACRWAQLCQTPSASYAAAGVGAACCPQVNARSEAELEAWLKSELILKNVARMAEHGLVRAPLALHSPWLRPAPAPMQLACGLLPGPIMPSMPSLLPGPIMPLHSSWSCLPPPTPGGPCRLPCRRWPPTRTASGCRRWSRAA